VKLEPILKGFEPTFWTITGDIIVRQTFGYPTIFQMMDGNEAI